MTEPEARILRQVSSDQDKLLRVLDALKYATVENIKIKEGKIKAMEIRIMVNLDDPESFKKTIAELNKIPT